MDKFIDYLNSHTQYKWRWESFNFYTFFHTIVGRGNDEHDYFFQVGLEVLVESNYPKLAEMLSEQMKERINNREAGKNKI